jgi:integrase/recombinase XerD
MPKSEFEPEQFQPASAHADAGTSTGAGLQKPQLDLAQEFLDTIDVAEHTRRTYRVALDALAQFVAGAKRDRDPKAKRRHDETPAVHIVALQKLELTTLARFRTWLQQEHHYTRRTVQTYLAGALRFVRWLEVRDRLPAPLSASRMQLILAEDRGRRRSYYIPQKIKESVPLIVHYFDALPHPAADTPRGRRQQLALLRNRAIAHTLFATGMRVQELVSLRRADAQEGDGTLLHIIGKGQKPRTVKLTADAKKAIAAYLKARDVARDAAREASARKRPASEKDTAKEPLFTRHDRELKRPQDLNPITTRMVGELIGQAAAALDLQTTISPHDFRRYIANTLLSQGMPLESVQAFLGHESPVTTRIVYAHSTWSEVLDDQLETYMPDIHDAVARALKKRGTEP